MQKRKSTFFPDQTSEKDIINVKIWQFQGFLIKTFDDTSWQYISTTTNKMRVNWTFVKVSGIVGERMEG